MPANRGYRAGPVSRNGNPLQKAILPLEQAINVTCGKINFLVAFLDYYALGKGLA
jgi:hypothetical protein